MHDTCEYQPKKIQKKQTNDMIIINSIICIREQALPCSPTTPSNKVLQTLQNVAVLKNLL